MKPDHSFQINDEYENSHTRTPCILLQPVFHHVSEREMAERFGQISHAGQFEALLKR